jgi:hypothetical protein
MHMTMIFVVAGHGFVYLALVGRPSMSARLIGAGQLDPAYRWRPLLSWTFAATLALQSYALALPEFLRSALHEVSLDSEWISPMWVLEESVRRLADGGLASVVLVAGLITVAGAVVSLIARNWRAGIVLIVPGALGGATMLALGHNLWPRFFFFCMGFALLLAVRGMMFVPEWLQGVTKAGPRGLAKTVGTAACLTIIGLSAWTLPRAYLPKQDFSSARRFVDQERQPGDGAIAVGLAGLAYHRYYAPDWPLVGTRADLEAIQRQHQNVWLVYTLPVHVKAWLPDIWDLIEREYEPVRVFPGTLGGGDVTVCRWRGARQS